MCCVLGPSCLHVRDLWGAQQDRGSRSIGIQDRAHRRQWRERASKGERHTQVGLVIRAMGGGFRGKFKMHCVRTAVNAAITASTQSVSAK